MIPGDSAIFSSFDPFGEVEDSIAQGNVELWDLSIINDKSLKGLLECSFVM